MTYEEAMAAKPGTKVENNFSGRKWTILEVKKDPRQDRKHAQMKCQLLNGEETGWFGCEMMDILREEA